jgi:uncharacterized membrane protein YGL010W
MSAKTQAGGTPHVFAAPDIAHAEAFVPPSAEQRFWARTFPWLFSPADGRGNLITRAWAVFSVAPYAHVTFFSLTYQAYLYDLFHQSKNARFWHQVCMPIVNFMIMVALAQFTLGGVWNGALAYTAVLAVWYLTQAAMERFYLWGLVMLPLLAGLLAGADLYYQAFAIPGAAWYAPTSLPANPFLWMTVCAAIQAFSHGTEAFLPPRVTGTAHWVRLPEFLNGTPGKPLPWGTRAVRLLRTALQSVWGTIDEWWASPRLFPLGILEQMWRHGYQPARFQELDLLTRRAIADGQPAIDYIGTGGGSYIIPK